MKGWCGTIYVLRFKVNGKQNLIVVEKILSELYNVQVKTKQCNAD